MGPWQPNKSETHCPSGLKAQTPVKREGCNKGKLKVRLEESVYTFDTRTTCAYAGIYESSQPLQEDLHEWYTVAVSL